MRIARPNHGPQHSLLFLWDSLVLLTEPFQNAQLCNRISICLVCMYSKVLFHLTRLENAFYRCSLPSYRPAAVFRQYWKSNLYTMLQHGINNAWGNYFFGNCFHCSHTAALQLVHYVNTSEWNVYFWSRLNLYFMLEHGVNDGVISSSEIVFTAQIQLYCSLRNTLTHMYDVYLKSRQSLYTMLEDGVDNVRGNYFFRDHHENMPI